MAHISGSRASGCLASLLAAVLATGCSGSINQRGTDRDGDGTAGSGSTGSGGKGASPGSGGGGSIDLPEPPAGAPRLTPASFASCGEGSVVAQPLRRLGTEQYRHTIEDLVRTALRDDAAATAAMKEIAPALDKLPDDVRPKLPGTNHGTFRRLDQTLQQGFVDASYDVASKTAEVLTRAEHLPKLLGSCAGAKDAQAAVGCVDAFVKSFGARALRAPIDDRQAQLYRGIYTGAAKETTKIDTLALADVIGTLLASPETMYLVEDSKPDALSSFELAARLSYHFWNTMPDERLWQAGEAGKLLTDDGYVETVNQVVADTRAKATLDEFFTEYWAMEDLPALDALNEDKAFKTYAGKNLPTATLRSAVVDEMLAFGRHFTWDAPGTFGDLLTSNLAFVKSAELAGLYGLGAPWDGSGAPPSLSSGERPGFLTRGAFLMTEGVVTRPIMRGVSLRTRFLCDEIPPPPDNSMDVAEAELKKLPPTASTRERTDAVTVKSSSACASCHQTLINPLGYPFEGFDTLSRLRTEETIIAAKTGQVAGKVPVDTSSVPRVAEGDTKSVAGASELVEIVAKSGRAHGCFARTYLRFAYGRPEQPEDADACVVAPMRDALTKGGTLIDAFRAVAYTPGFRRRAL